MSFVIAPRQLPSGHNSTVPAVLGESPNIGINVGHYSNGPENPAGAGVLVENFGVGVLFPAGKPQPSVAAQSYLIDGLQSACGSAVNITLSSACGGFYQPNPYCNSGIEGSVMNTASWQSGKDTVVAVLGVEAGFETSPGAICLAENLQPALQKALVLSSSGSSSKSPLKKETLALAALAAVALLSNI